MSLFLCGAPSSFSTWELSPPLRMCRRKRKCGLCVSLASPTGGSRKMGVVVFCSGSGAAAAEDGVEASNLKIDYITQHAARHSCQQLGDLLWKSVVVRCLRSIGHISPTDAHCHAKKTAKKASHCSVLYLYDRLMLSFSLQLYNKITHLTFPYKSICICFKIHSSSYNKLPDG